MTSALGVPIVCDHLEVAIRRAGAEDQSFIAASWEQQLALVAGAHRQQTRRLWVSPENRADVNRVLDHVTARVVVATEPSNVSIILGWLAYEPMPSVALVYFAYTRSRVRRRGIQRSLWTHAGLDGRPVVYTLVGPTTDALLAGAKTKPVHMDLDQVLA